MQERGTIMKQDRRSTKLSDDDVETLDIPDGVELEEIKTDDDESRTDDSSTHTLQRGSSVCRKG